MSHARPRNASLWLFLLTIDRELATELHKQRCPHCKKGVLHQGDFPRKPRGGPDELPPEYKRRFSLCCSVCRRRVTPPSVRFLDSKVYLSVVVLLTTAMRQGPSPRSAKRLHQLFGADPRTIERWRTFWREAFPESRRWKVLKGFLSRPVDEKQLPRSLLQRLRERVKPYAESLLQLLKLVSGIAGRCRSDHAF